MPSVGRPRENGKTFAENARIKALHYAQAHKVLCIADDSGLAVEALGGCPACTPPGSRGGATDEQNTGLLLQELSKHPRPWKASFVCVAMAALPGRIVAQATGTVQGEILPARAGGGLRLRPGVPRLLAREDDGGAADGPQEPGQPPRFQRMRSLIAEMKNAGLLLA